MQLLDLVKPLENMTDEELAERLRDLRHRRSTVRPASKKRVERAAKKGNTTRINKLENLLLNLSDSDRQTLLDQLGD